MANEIRQALKKLLVAYPSGPKTPALAGVADQHLAVYSALARNMSGGSADVAILRAVNQYNRKSYTMVSGTLTDVSSSLDVGSSVTILAGVGDALYIGGKDLFGLVGLTVGTAQVGGTIVYEYWNGSAWATLNTFVAQVLTSTGDRIVLFPPPYDWAAGDGAITGLDQDFYHIRLRVTAATATDPIISAYWQGLVLEYQEAVADNAAISLTAVDSHKPLILEAGEGLYPYFSTNSNLNLFSASYNFKQ